MRLNFDGAGEAHRQIFNLEFTIVVNSEFVLWRMLQHLCTVGLLNRPQTRIIVIVPSIHTIASAGTSDAVAIKRS